MKLERKIHAINEVNRAAKIVLDNVLPQLEKYLDQKIYLASGGKASKFNISFPAVELSKFEGKDYALVHRCYIEKSYRSIYLSFAGCFKQDEVGCFYEDVKIWLGDLDATGQVLTKVAAAGFEFEPYEIETVRSQMKQKAELEHQISALKSKLRSFSDGYFG